MGNRLGKLDASGVVRRRALCLLAATSGDREQDRKLLNHTLSNALKGAKGRFERSLGKGRDAAAIECIPLPSQYPDDSELDSFQSPPKRARTKRRSSVFTTVTPSPPPPDAAIPPSPFDAASVSTDDSGASHLTAFDPTRMRRCIMEDIERLDVGDNVVIGLTVKSNKFSEIRRQLQGDLSLYETKRFDESLYLFPAVVKSFQHRDTFSTSPPSPKDQERWIKEGDGFTVTLLDYNLSFPIRMKDCYQQSTEIWERERDDFVPHDWYAAMGRTRDPTQVRAFYERLLREVEGDRCQTLEIVIAALRKRYDYIMDKLRKVETRNEELAAALERQEYHKALPHYLERELSSETAKQFLDAVDHVYELAISSHFDRWHDANEPLIPPAVEDAIMEAFKSKLKMTASFFMSISTTDKNRTPSQLESDKVKLKQVKALHAFFSLMRVRNNKLLTHWAACDALGQASRATPLVAINASVWRGFSTAYNTAFSILEKIAEKAEERMRTLLMEEDSISVAIDNHQQVLFTKTQIANKSSKVLDGTVRAMKKNVKVPPPIGSLIVHTSLSTLPATVRRVVPVSDYEYQLDVEVLPQQIVTIRWPQKGLKLVHMPNAPENPDLTYLHQLVPRSIFMRKHRASYLNSFIFDTLPSIFSPTLRQLDFQPMLTDEYMDAVSAAFDMRRFKMNLSSVPTLPSSHAPPENGPPTVGPQPKINDASATSADSDEAAGKQVVRRRKRKHAAYEDALTDHDFRRTTPSRLRTIDAIGSLLDELEKAGRFQEAYTSSWNPTIDSVSQLMYAKMSKHDEITKDGIVKMFLELLHDIGLTSKDGDDSYKCTDDIADRLIFIFGDCVTMENLNKLEDRIRKELCHPGKAEYVQNILRAIDATREMQGDLHLAMHMLAVLHKFFYPGLLQVCQAVLRYKRVQLNPLPRYQQSKRLLALVYDEMERYRQTEWIETLKVFPKDHANQGIDIPPAIAKRYSDVLLMRTKRKDASNSEGWTLELSLVEMTELLSGPDQLMCLQRAYATHVRRQEDSSDRQLAHCAQFMKLAKSYLLFQDAVRCGDAIAIESIAIEWLPRWKHAGKHRYVDLICRMIDTNYSKLTAMEREEVRWNRTVRMSAGRARVALDDVCEMLNDWVKEMTKSDDANSLSDKTLFVSLMRRCARSVGANGLARRETQSSSSPSMIRERRQLYQLFSMAKIWTEVPGRTIGDDWLWSHFSEDVFPVQGREKEEKEDKFEAKVAEIFCKLSKKEFVGLTDDELIALGDEIKADDVATAGNDDVMGQIDAEQQALDDADANARTDGHDDVTPGVAREDVATMEDTELDSGIDAGADTPNEEEESTVSGTVKHRESRSKGTATDKKAVVECLKKIEKYKIDKAAFANIDEAGAKALGPNMAEERRVMRQKLMRKRKRIEAAVTHYAKREAEREQAMDKCLAEVGSGILLEQMSKWERDFMQWKEKEGVN